MIVLLVGPSGVGKSTTYQAIEARFPNWVFRHLDGLASAYALRQGWIAVADVHVLRNYAKNDDHFLAIGLQAITDLAVRNEGRHLIIDVGSGFQGASYANRLPYHYPTVAIIGAPEVVHARWQTRPGNIGSLTDYKHCEFSDHKRALYDRSREKIDTSSLTIDQAADLLAAALRRIID